MVVKNINELNKSRIRLSAEEIKKLGGLGVEVIIRRKGDKLIFYTKKEWSRFTKKILRGLRGQLLRRVTRFLFGDSSATVNISKQGRVFIPPNLRERS